jgi:hypothetical protein
MVNHLWGNIVRAVNSITQRQDVMGRPGRKVLDMRPATRANRGCASGRAWVGEKTKITYDPSEAGATRFLYLKTDGSGYTWAVSMPDQQPADGVVYDLDQTYGDIHLPGTMAPGG